MTSVPITLPASSITVCNPRKRCGVLVHARNGEKFEIFYKSAGKILRPHACQPAFKKRKPDQEPPGMFDNQMDDPG